MNGRALALRALDADRAAVQLHQFLHQRQPDAACPRACAPRAPSTRWKRSKRRGSSLGGDADAGVAHRQLDAAPPAPPSDTVISPSKVYLKALERRLRTIFSHISRST